MSIRAAFTLSILATLAACTDDAPRPLPLGEELGHDVLRYSVHVIDDAIYWIEIVPSASSDVAPSLRLRRADATGISTVDVMDGYYNEQGTPFVVIDREALIWGTGSALLGCGRGRWVRASVPPVSLGFLTEQGVCRALPVTLRGGRVLAMTLDGPETEPMTVLARYDLSTNEVEPGGELFGAPVERPLVIGDEAIATMTTPARRSEGQLVRFELAAPAQQRGFGATIQDRGGIAVTDDQIAVLDNGGAGAPARVLGYPRAATPGTPATVIATLPGPARSLTTASGALWMIADPPPSTDGSGATSATIWQIARDGTRTEFIVDALLGSLDGTGDALVSVATNDDGHPSLRRIPLPAQ